MKKKFVRLISAVLSAVMTLTAVPLSAFAEGEAHTHDGESNVITTPLDFREKTADENGIGWSWVYDTKTLTLDGVNIQATTSDMSVVTVPDGTEIVLKGKNTIVQTNTGDSDTYVLSAVNTDTTNCDGTMTISGDGVLNAENRSTDSMARSLGGSIILNGGTVNATGTVKTNLLEIHNDGVLNANATTTSFEGVAVNVGGGITVDGNGSLTAVGGAVENEYANNGAILLNSNFGDKISVSENGSITVPEGNAAKVGIYYGGNNGDGMDAEISGGKVTAYGTKYGIYKVNLIMSGTGSVYTTGGSYAIGQTVPTIDEDEFVVKGSTESKASESAVTSEVKLNGGYYEIDGADAKTVVIKPDTEPSIKLGKQIGAVYADDVGNNSYAYFYITAKNFADGTFVPEAEWVTSPSRVNIDADITKKGGKYVCEVTCDEPDLSRQYELRVKSGEVYSNTVTVTVGKPHFALTSRDSQSKYYTNYNGEQKITLRYDVEAGYENQDGLQYNWSSDSKKYDIADLGAVNTVDGVETLVFSDNVPEGSYVIYCDVVYNNDYGEAYTLTERFAFTFEECKHTGGFTGEVCDICHNACDHKNIDTDTGKCVCGRQFVATISTDGSAPTGYDTLADCLNSITADSGNYVKIYQDIEKDSSQKYIVKYHVTLDLNGHRLDDELEINEKNSEDNNGELTLTGTGYINNVYAYSNTTFTIDDNANIEADTFFNNAGTRFTVSDGANVTVRYLAVKESISSEGNATSVKLATGMKITEMLAYDRDISSPLSENIMLKNLLSDNQMLKYESSSKIIDLYYGASRIIINSKTYGYGTITVVEHTDHSFDGTTGKCTECGKPCEHGGDINADNGKCSICGKVCGAIVIKADGTAVGCDDLAAAFAEAGNNNGCTLKLFSNYEPSKVIEVSGKFTIDLNGKQCLNSKNIIIGKNATITLTGNSNSSYISKFKVAGGTLTVSADYNGSIDSITVQDGKLDLYSGRVESLHIEAGADIALYGGFIKDVFNNTGDTILLRSLLADGYAFATKDDSGTLTVANKYDSTISPFENIKLYVVEHKTCSYDKDNPTGKCKECGKPCEHGGDINTDNGICSVCGAVVSIALYKDASGSLHFIKTTDELRNTLGDPNVNGTIKLFGDCSFDSDVGFSGKFTFDFNGHAVIMDSNIVSYIVINENAVITVAGSQAENASVNFDVKTGGALTLAADYDGSTYVTMNGGKLDVYNGVVSYLNIHKDSEIKLYGGHFRHIVNVTYTSFELGKMLGDGYAYADHTTNSIVNVYNYVLKGEGVGSYSELNVVKHEACSYDKESATGECKECGRSCPHNGNIDIESGVCDICGGVGVVARYTDENGNASLISTADDLHNMLSDTDVSGTITLFKDYKKTGTTTAYTICKELTIDLNGHNFSYRGVAVDGGKVTLENSGSKQAIFPGIGPSVDNGGTIIVNGDISFDGAISTNDKSTVILNAGTFDGTGFTASGSKTVYSMLGEGKAFFKDDGTLFNANVKRVTSADGKLTIGEHPKHTYNEGKCDCGYVCPHDELNVETGICGKCGYQYAAIIVKDGEIISRYEGKDGVMLTNAFLSANSEENKGCTLGVFKNHINACFDLTSEFNLIVGNNVEIVNLNIKGNIKIGSVDGEDGFIGRLNVADGGTLTFDKSCAFKGTLTVGEGTFDCYNANGAKLIIENKSGNVTLHGGRFSGISYTCDDERKNELLVTLLADESAYYSIYSDLINGSLGTLGEGFGYTVVVKEHTHSFESDGKCMCGRVCPHSDVDIDTGKCTECEYQYAAVIVKDGAVASVYKDTEMEAAFEAADSDANTGCTLRVYKNYTDSYTTLSGKFTLWLGTGVGFNALTVSENGNITVKNGKLQGQNLGNFIVGDSAKLTFGDKNRVCGTVTVDAGTFDCYGANGVDLIINNENSNVTLYGGYFKSISYKGGGDRENTGILSLLAEKSAFYQNSKLLDGSSITLGDGLSSPTYVNSHNSHSYDIETGKCGCGRVCGHTDINTELGKCTTCQHQFVATLTVNGETRGFDSLEDCFSNTSEESENYVKIYKNIDDRTTINVNHTVTVDLNGHKLYYIELKVNNDNGAGNLTLTGSEGSYISQVYVCGGRTFKIDSDANINFETIFVEAGARFEVSYGANVTVNTLVVKESLTLYGSTTTSVRLTTGMRIGTLTYDLDRNSGSGNLLLYSLLGEGKALQYDNSGEYVDIYEKFTSKIIRDSFTVVYHYEHSYDKATGKCVCGYVCPHSDVDSKTGVCSVCEYQLTAGISGVGTAKYFDNIDNAFTAALSEVNSGCTLTLYKDCELSQNIVIGNATVTVDMNGHSILLAYRIKVNDGGVLYLKNSGENGSIETEIDVNKGGTLINGTADDSRSAVSVFGVTADAAKRVEIYGGSYEGLTVNNGTSGIALYGGSYESINTNDLTDSTPVSALLAKGYAFATLNSVTHLPESIVDGSETNLNPGLENVMVVAHTHTYTETNPKCACGAVLYAKVTSADGTSNKYFDSIEEGLLYADKAENKGCVFTLVARGLLKDKVTLSSGQFTIATATTDNTYVIGPYEGKITIDGADVIAEGDLAIRCNVYVKSGSLTLPEGSGTGFDSIIISGGTVTISEGVNADSYAGADNLSVDKDATDVKLTIGGGTYGNVYFGQLKLKDVLASGVRVISYDNPSDPTAEKTATALLYSDIAEESSLNSNNGTVSYYLVTKCEHKNEYGSYAFNDGGICKYCGSEFAASVSYTTDDGEKTELFSDIYDAFDKANEVGTATITLYKDITDDITDTIAVTGNVTVELNDKKLSTPGFDPYYAIEVKSGKLTVNGSGSIKRAVVRNGGDAEINGGTFSDFRIEDGGNAVINGGQFYSIKVLGEGRNVGQLLADGYAYRSFNDSGFWSTVAEREKQGIASVNVLEAPIKSASIAWADGGTPVVYRNGDKYLNVNVTYELAVGSRGATYSDFVNGNNRIKDYNLYTNIKAHCYEIGKLAAKDGEVEYYTVLKCNGYEYKSNVLKLKLATCSHPEDSFLYENNGLVICGICDALIEAEVVDADGKSLGYADIESAIKLAQENEGSTVKLMSDGVSSATEFTTVTGGKFTVDFNGKTVFYQFAVSGGDLTFTSSVKQADAETLISGITVNGTDAKVTIDGKIKLGSVTLTSGTLTVNSTDGYIKELSINGGKADIDGAEIDTLVFKGGDLAIRNVTVGSLDINKKATDATEHNIVIESGSFDTITCSDDSDYNIVKTLASERRLRGTESGIIYEYSEIESLTKATDITVEKCDHKYANGNIAVDDDYACYYCNSQIIATVSYTADGSEKTELFGDIYDAFDKANEVGTATVTLCRDITDDITDTIAVTGNVTLELNGKTLGSTFVFIAPVEVSDGGMFTVGGDGKMRMPIKAYANSKLIINGGEFTSVMVYIDGDAEIGGGVIDALTIIGNAKAKISGGKFYNIEIANGSLESVLADGYAYKKDGGAWLSIAERAESVYSGVNNDNKPVNVEEAPIKSATITANDESPIIYRNGRKTASFTADVTYTGNETLYVTGYLIDGTVIKEKTDLSGNRYYLFSGEVDKAVAEDGEIQYYCIFTYDGYEYKSNVVTLTVATCQHPGESVKCDDNGNYVCGICDRTLTASVELSDGTLSYYGKWNDAIGAAEESEGCTLKLLNYSGLKDNETFDISKGRFTVDFNKDDGSGLFTFNVKGGDITFTTSQATSNPWACVQVSGENANVLIDSKARLNSLVVNSGNVSADGAYIGIITINGGDTVINDVDAGLLSKEGNGSVNISIVSGRFESVVFDEYTFGKAIASGSRIRLTDADGGKIYKYADIQNKGNAGVIVVEKCDHKDENDSYKLDGKPCPYCNEEIVATVSYTTADGSETTDLFSDIYDAFEKANEAGTATITLYKDIENSEFTRYITVTGNVTLALNGKKLGYSFVSRTVEVSDGGMLTVDGDGKMMVPIIVNENAKLTVNGGEIATVMIYKDGDAVIGGGFIEDLDVNGNVKLSGGKFYNIEIANGSLESILADGYAYKKDGGAWLSIAERAKEKYYSWNNDNKPVNVEEAPIKSATLSTEINKLYRNSNANPTVKFNPALAHGSLNDSDASMRYGINSYESGDTVYNSLSTLVTNTKLSADEIIDKAGNSNVAEIYYIVTFDGYEVKTNTVCIDLVDCDHSQVVDPTADKETAGNITTPTYCEICESKFNAKITKGDDVRYYNDLDEAAKDAQKSENEGCTLYPLYNKNGYGGQLVITDGNFTLKYAVRTAFANPVLITGEAKLKVTGRCAVTSSENPDAFFVDGGDVTFDGLATGSNVTINGGNVTMAANNINCLTINGGNVSISSGGFAEIVTTVSNKVIADYIEPGFWVQDRGTKEWIDIYSLNKATASSTNVLSVRLCPMQIIKPIDTVYYTNGYYPGDIPSLQISAEPWYSNEVNAKVAYQWIAIDENGNETEIEGATDRKLSLENLTTGRYYCRLTYSNAATAGVSMASDVVTATITECEHSGGEATCTNKAKCEICGAEYGETKPHSYAHIKASEYLKSAATCTAKAVYYTSCTECGQSSKGTADEATFEYGNALGHKYGEWVSNGDGTHTRVCANDSTHTETKDCHGGKATCTAKAICEDCGKAYGEMTAHTFTAKTVSEKYLKSAATCTAKAVYYTSCADCGLSSKGTKNEAMFEYGNALGHKYGKWVSNGDGTHTRVCANDNKHTETKACHGGKATCTAKAICEDCGKAYGEMTAHTFTAKTASAKYLKTAATCTAKAVYYTSCADCGLSSKGTKNEATFEYGNALGHKYGKWVSNGDGTHTRVCANDSTHTETKACHGGKATCTAKAICEDCGKAYGEMTAHTFTAKTASAKYLKSAATCTAKAVYYTSCADCGLSSKGTKNEATFEYGNALGHKYGKWVSNGDGTHTRVCANDSTHTETKACHGGKATCTAKAICEDCGKAYGEMTAHTFTAKSTVSRYLKRAATCTEKSEYYVSCAGCGLSSKGTVSEAVFTGSALGHSLTDWNVTVAATCTSGGSQERHCTRCDYKQTKTISAKGHKFGAWKITKAVSCLEDGEQSRVCSVCKKTEVKKIAATGVHTYGAWKVTKKATCTATGVKERTCTSCGAKEKITLKATGHKYVTSTVKPTYTSKGYTLHKCSVCGSSYKSNYTATLVLAPISGLKRTARTNTTVTLSWNKHSAADGYIVERYNGKTWVRVAKISKNSTTSYTVKSLTPSTTNKFRVKAYKSTASSAYSYVTVNTLPNGVTGFKATSKTSTTVTLSWNKNSSAGGYIIEYYNGTKWVQSVKISGNATVKATVKGIAAGKSNKLRIKVYKVIGSNTVYSAYTQLTVKTKPTDVTGLKAVSKTNNTVKLQWNKNTSADSYIIEKYSGNKWVQVTKISGNATTSYTVSGLKSSTTYRLRIKAVKSGEYSNCTYINVTTKPYAVNAFKAKSISKSAITLQWNKNTSADGYCIEKYNGTKWVQVKRYTSNASTTYTLKSLKAGTTYKFRIRAYKTVGKTTEYSTYTYCNVTTKK